MKMYDMVHKYGWNILAVLPSIPNVRAEGSIYFVDSGATDALNAADGYHGHSWETPFATLNFAVSQCTADQGDIILIAPGHAETIADTGTASGTTTDELVIDVAGISIIGIGTGSLRPTFTFNGATDAACVILAGATNVYIKNLVFAGGLEDLANLMTVSGTSDGLTVEECEFRDGGTNILETVHQINLATGADRVTLKNCQFYTTSGGSSTLANIEVAAVDRLTITGCLFSGDVNTDGQILNNLDAATGKCIVLNAATTGVVKGNIAHAGLDGTSPFTVAGVVVAQNYYSNAEGASAAILNPATDT
jgi:hypothetical protein